MRELSMFALSALLAAAAQLVVASCADDGDECGGIEKLAQFPAARAAAKIIQVSSYNAQGEREDLPFDLKQGTIELQEKQVLIRYTVDDQAREVVYDILPES